MQDLTVSFPLGNLETAGFAFSYVNHGLGLGVGADQNREGCDGGKSASGLFGPRSRDVMGGNYWLAILVNRRAPKDDASIILPVVDGVDRLCIVALPRDGGFDVLKIDCLAAINLWVSRARLDWVTGLHANRQLHASVTE